MELPPSVGHQRHDFGGLQHYVRQRLHRCLDLQYARGARLVFGTGVGAGINKFLGVAGAGRKDTYFSVYGRIGYTFSERLRLGLVYSYYKNWSTLAFSDFARQSVTFDASSRF
ncbi:MAG: hypothetical protein J6386_15405 [Candidatus Synoicihabitans palmerolidicus]|nr:hypothetical protein [Candidatus Synoicihabitans palmerolidicus]